MGNNNSRNNNRNNQNNNQNNGQNRQRRTSQTAQYAAQQGYRSPNDLGQDNFNRDDFDPAQDIEHWANLVPLDDLADHVWYELIDLAKLVNVPLDGKTKFSHNDILAMNFTAVGRLMKFIRDNCVVNVALYDMFARGLDAQGNDEGLDREEQRQRNTRTCLSYLVLAGKAANSAS